MCIYSLTLTNVWVCVGVYILTHTHKCVGVCVCVYTHSHSQMCVRVCVCVYTHSHSQMCGYVCVCVYTHSHSQMCVCVCVYTHSHSQMCGYVCVCIYSHTFAYMHSCNFWHVSLNYKRMWKSDDAFGTVGFNCPVRTLKYLSYLQPMQPTLWQQKVGTCAPLGEKSLGNVIWVEWRVHEGTQTIQ